MMQLCLHVVVLSALALALSACEKFRNRVDPAALQCGLSASEQNAAQGLVQIVQADGSEWNESDIQSLRVQFVNLQGTTDLAPTRKGCVQIPEALGQGQLQAYLKDTRMAGVTNLSLPLREVPRLPLQLSQEPEVSLRCESGSLYAVDRLENPILVRESGTDDVLGLRLEAHDESTGVRYPLADKTIGTRFASLQNASFFDVSRLPEGLYSLQLVLARLSDEFGQTYTKVAQDRPCQLAVLKTAPQIESGIFSRSGFLVLRHGSDWPLRPDLALKGYKVKACQQPLASRADQAQSCEQMAGHCAQDSHFQDLTATVPESPGVFDFFFKIEDPAGNRSNLSCQTIGITQDAPQVRVSWEKSEWNLPGAAMQRPEPAIIPKIEITEDEDLPRSRVQDMLQCRVEFQSHLGNITRGNDAVCLTGRCQGRTLEDFVPCDDTFSFSIARAWNNSYVLNSQLKLTIRIDDGTNDVRLVTRSVGIPRTRWSVEEIALPTGETAEVNEVVQIDKNRLLVLAGNKRTYVYDTKAPTHPWTLASLKDAPDAQVDDAKIVRDEQGQILATFTLLADSRVAQRRLAFAKWQDGTWIELGSSLDASHCRFLLARPSQGGGAVCVTALRNDETRAFTNKGLWALDGLQAAALSSEGLDDFLKAQLGISVPLSLAADGSAMLVNNFHAYWAPSANGPWQRVINLQAPNASPVSIAQVMGASDEHWVYAMNVADQKVFRVRSDAGSVQALEIPSPLFTRKLPDTSRAMNVDSRGRIRFFAYVWDALQQQWSLDPGVEAAGLELETKLDRDLDGLAWLRTDGSFLQDDRSHFGFWPTGAYGARPIKPIMQDRKDELVFLGTQENVLLRRLYRFRMHPVFVLNHKASGPFQESFPNIWSDAKGRIFSPAVRDSTVYVFDEDGWRKHDTIPNKTSLNFREQFLPLDNGGLGALLGFGLYLKPGADAPWERLAGVGDPARKFFPTAPEGDILQAPDFKLLAWIGADAADNVYLFDSKYQTILVRRADGKVRARPFADFGSFTWPKTDAHGLVMISNQKILRLDDQLQERLPTPQTLESHWDALRQKFGIASSHLKKSELLQVEGMIHQVALCSYWGSQPGGTEFDTLFCVDIGPDGEPVSAGESTLVHRVTGKTEDPKNILKIGRTPTHHVLAFANQVFESPRQQNPQEMVLILDAAGVERNLGRATDLESLHVDRFGRVFLGYQRTGILVYDRRMLQAPMGF